MSQQYLSASANIPADDNWQPQISTDLLKYWDENRLDFAFYRTI